MSGGDWKEMFNAGVAGDLELVNYHIRQGVDLNYAHPEFLSTPLVAAILAGQPAVALRLLEAGADPTLGSEFDGVNPIQAARRAGLQGVEARLVQLGVPALPAAEPAPAWWARLLPERWRGGWATDPRRR